MNKLVTIRFSDEDFIYITKEAKKERLSRSSWVRRKVFLGKINN
jgi:hypothetical protein|tara:strand:+ start:1489 stop:1620 length:132 start_codon:yes stop_codon:yes gene_type:complete